jgi:SAM-dependent methyltransferase
LLTEALHRINPGNQYLNLDLSVNMASLAKGTAPTIVGDVQKMPLANASVDVVIYRQVLHYCAELGVALAEARRVLRHEGRLLIGQFVPLNRAEQIWMEPLLALRQPLRKNYFTIEQWSDALAGAGFTLLRSTRIGIKESLDSWLMRYDVAKPNEYAIRRAFNQRDRRMQYPKVWRVGQRVYFRNWFALFVCAKTCC